MFLDEVFARFATESPVSVIFRGTLEHVLSAERLDRLFARTARKQYARELAFSTCVELLGLVVLQIRPNVHAAYRLRRDQVCVSVQALYEKLAHVEPAVTEALVRETACDLGTLVDRLEARQPSPLAGFDVRIVDGNHLRGTEHRLQELRRLGDAAMPGHTLAVLDPQRELIEELVESLDGHASQKPLTRRLLPLVQARQCWIADRDFSTKLFLGGVAQRGAYFLVRHHRVLALRLIGKRRRVGPTATGDVYEQAAELIDESGQRLRLRRITVALKSRTRDQATELHLLSNLPAEVEGRQIADAYRSRWSIEAAFHKLTTVLRCELNTLGYPEAALFGFALAVVMYNIVGTLMAALRAAHGDLIAAHAQKTSAVRRPRHLSFYYLTVEITGMWRGMTLLVPDSYWAQQFARRTADDLAPRLLELARQVRLEPFLTNPVRVKKRKPPRPTRHGGHVSTHRLLQQRRKQPQ